jgi:restriction endonuclease S subunit
LIPKKRLSELIIQLKKGVSSYHFDEAGEPVKLINIGSLKDGEVDWTAVTKTKLKDAGYIMKQTQLTKNDVLIGLKGSFKAGMVKQDAKDALFSTNLIAFRVNEELIKPQIVIAYLNSPEGQKQLQAQAVGVAQKSISQSRLMNITIPVPPINIQKKIAAYLELAAEEKRIAQQEKELRDNITKKIIDKYMGSA